MITKTTFFATILALSLPALVGCGGNVILDPSGGGAGGGGGGNGGNTTSSSSITTSTTTTTDPVTFCTSICTTAANYGCLAGTSVAECAKGCEDVFNQYPMCSVEVQGLYQCFVDQLPQTGCNGDGSACQKQNNAFAACAGGTSTCGSDGCGGGGNDCFCTGSCNGYQLEADCKTAPDGVQCVCFVDGGQVATCTDVDLSCDIFNGCCAAYFPI